MTDSDSEPKNILSILDQMANSVTTEDTNLSDFQQSVSWERGCPILLSKNWIKSFLIHQNKNSVLKKSSLVW